MHLAAPRKEPGHTHRCQGHGHADGRTGERAGEIDLVDAPSALLWTTDRASYGQLARLLSLSDLHIYLTVPFVLSWSFLEAMSAGCVVLGSDTPSVTEILRDGENGLLVDFFDREGIADRIDAVLDHPDRMQRLRDNARRTIIEQYDLRMVALPNYLKLIERVLNGELKSGSG